VNRCTQVFHRNAWTPLQNRGKIVDMIAPVGVLIAAATLAAPAAPTLDPQHLPTLPARGFTLQLRTGVQLETMLGRPIGVLKGLFPAPDKATGDGLIMRDGRGRLFVLDLGRRRVRPVREQLSPVRGCRVTDGRVRLLLLVCGHTVKTALFRLSGGAEPTVRIVAHAPGRVGHWERAEFAPRGNAFLAQWSAECEVPVAFLVTAGVMRPYGGTTMRDAPSSVALGWLPNGNAVIHFPNGACGGAFRAPGIYDVPRAGKPRLLRRTPSRAASYWMWGG
jgi:hypothetical protein